MVGVKTVVFGPPAWRTLEGLAKLYDDAMQSEEFTKEQKKYLFYIYMSLFFLFGIILPCIYCRVSYQEFVSQPKRKEINVQWMLQRKNGCKKLVYYLHDTVSEKLQGQELEKALEKDRSKIKKKWQKKRISLDYALQTRFKSIETTLFWKSFFEFMGYVMCDFRSNDVCSFFLFLQSFVDVFFLLNCPLQETLRNSWMEFKKKWKTDQLHHQSYRFDILWKFQKDVFQKVLNTKPIFRTPSQYEKFCTSAIVGC